MAPADSNDAPLFRFNGLIQAVLADDFKGGMTLVNPGKRYFVVTGQYVANPELYYLTAEFVGGSYCGRQFLIPSMWDDELNWKKMCSFIKDGLPTSGESGPQPQG